MASFMLSADVLCVFSIKPCSKTIFPASKAKMTLAMRRLGKGERTSPQALLHGQNIGANNAAAGLLKLPQPVPYRLPASIGDEKNTGKGSDRDVMD